MSACQLPFHVATWRHGGKSWEREQTAVRTSPTLALYMVSYASVVLVSHWFAPPHDMYDACRNLLEFAERGKWWYTWHSCALVASRAFSGRAEWGWLKVVSDTTAVVGRIEFGDSGLPGCCTVLRDWHIPTFRKNVVSLSAWVGETPPL